MRDPNPDALERWLDESRSPEGRRRLLGDSGAPLAAAARGLLRAYITW
jgi:hypothetical protein